MQNIEKPFFCYSKRLYIELKENGIYHSFIGTHDKTGNKYWLYMPSKQLTEYLNNRRNKYK